MKVLYFQYGPPQNYPPLLRGARLFADRGWEARFNVPACALDPDLESFVNESGARSTVLGRSGLSGDKAVYLSYLKASIQMIRKERPDWVYLSDLYSTPIGLCLPKNTRVIYHEHDQFCHPHPSAWMKLLVRMRTQACRRAELIVVPNVQRLRILRDQTGAAEERCLCVWNCPSLSEVGPARGPIDGGLLKVIYVGAITPDRGIETTVRALPADAELELVGYETLGSRGYVDEILRLARSLGIGERVSWKGAVMSRRRVLELIRSSAVGICLLPADETNVNMKYLVGASNKVFDLMAAGSLPLVLDRPDWRRTFVEPGYAVACASNDRRSVGDALQWVAEHPREVLAAGELGRSKILRDWNYETTFGPVLERMSKGGGR